MILRRIALGARRCTPQLGSIHRPLGGSLNRQSFVPSSIFQTSRKTFADQNDTESPLTPEESPLTPEDEKEFSIWDAPDMEHIFRNNRKWVKDSLKEDPLFFERLKDGQQPEYLLIGCSDSRVPAQAIMGLHTGQLFVHRNVANLVVNTDLNMLSVLQYAVEVLKVKDILVLGHYGCGGVMASTQKDDKGLIEHWLRNIRDVQRTHVEQLAAIECDDQRFRRLVELNVEEQCLNLFKNTIVQKQQALSGRPRIHGFVYDIADGKLKRLDINFKKLIARNKDIYATRDFPNEQSKAK